MLSDDLFAETVIPHLCKIVLVRDHDIFLTLLRFLPKYLHLIPKEKLEETFLPQMLLGLQVICLFVKVKMLYYQHYPLTPTNPDLGN